MIGQFIVKKEFLMKKKLGLLAIFLVLLTLTFAVSSCGDEDKAGVEGKWTAKLQDQPGWAEMKGMAEAMGIKGDTVVMEAEFKGGKVTMTQIDPITGAKETATGTYTQSGSTVTITIDGETSTATVNGNTLTGGEGENAVVLKRK